MLKKVLISTAAATAMLGSAIAADLPSRKAPPVAFVPPPIMTWTGFYFGVNAGGTFSGNNNNNMTAIPGPCNPAFPGCAVVPNYSVTSATAINLSGLNGNGNGSRGAFIGGGQIGFNFQVSPAFLVGFETDIQGVAGSRNNNNGFNNGAISVANPNFPGSPLVQFGNLNNNQQLRYLGTVRGRLGFIATPSLLLYGTGGLAYGGMGGNNNNGIVQSILNCTGAGTPSCSGVLSGNNGSNTRIGYTIGGGLEWMFMPNWSVKAEYLYYDLRRSNNNNGQLLALSCNDPACAVPGGLIASSLITRNNPRMNGHIARVGINYHFNWAAPAPVVARY